MDVVRSSAAASQETTVFVKKWWGRLSEASAKTSSTYLTPSSQPAGKLSVVRSALDVIDDVLELHSQVMGMVTELDQAGHLARYVDSDDLPTCFAGNKLLAVLANHGLIRSDCRETLLQSVTSRLELVQCTLQTEAYHRPPLTDVSLNLVLSPPSQDKEPMHSSLRAQLEAVHNQLVVSICALLQTQSLADSILTSCLCRALDILLQQCIRDSSASPSILSAERNTIATHAMNNSFVVLSRVTGEEQQNTVRFFFTHLTADKMHILKLTTKDFNDSMFHDLMESNAQLNITTTPESQVISTVTAQPIPTEAVLPSDTPLESSRYVAMEDSDTVQLEAPSDDDESGSYHSSPLDDVIPQSRDEALDSVDSAMQSLAVGILPSQQHQLIDDMHSIDRKSEESRWKARYELCEARRIRLEDELAIREAKVLELEMRCNDAMSRLQLTTEDNQALELRLETKTQELEELIVLDGEKADRIKVLEKGLDEAWVKLKVSLSNYTVIVA